jgi:hypothetical protein
MGRIMQYSPILLVGAAQLAGLGTHAPFCRFASAWHSLPSAYMHCGAVPVISRQNGAAIAVSDVLTKIAAATPSCFISHFSSRDADQDTALNCRPEQHDPVAMALGSR